MRKVMKQIVGPYQGNAYEDGQQYPSVSVVKMPSPQLYEGNKGMSEYQVMNGGGQCHRYQ